LPPLLRVGVWEDSEFIGCVLFGRGATPTLAKSFSLLQTEISELTRIALRTHSVPVSQIVAVALRMFRKLCPRMRLIVSFADPAEGHHGGIYQGLGWLYSGTSQPATLYWSEGRWKHTREVMGGAFGGVRKLKDGGKGLPIKVVPGKHRYLLPLDAETRARLSPLAKPYPKRDLADRAGKSSPAGPAGGEGGAVPTPALQGR
jgi:hypothetical protein